MKYIPLIFIIFLFSCKTTKYVDKVKTVVDSTAIKERDAIARVLKEEVERFEKEKEAWEETGVTFETTPCPDSTKTVTKIIFDNGKIKSIEGNVKALNQSLYEKSAELYDAHSVIDSLQVENEKLQTQVSKKEIVVHREVERKWYVPIWVWIALGLFFVFGSHPYIKNIINKIKNYGKKRS